MRNIICRRICAALLLAAVSAVVTGSARAAHQEREAARIDALVRSEMAQSEIPGLSLAVVREGKVVLSKGYGYANAELRASATADTVYQIGSVTKQFTATLIMMLVAEGKIGLEDPLSKYLPETPEAWRPVTVRQLLNHTSGIKSYTSVEGFDKTLRKDFTPRELLGLVEKTPIEFAPGTKWNYNNTGYYLLGLILEKASGKTYSALVTERILQPLGMTATRVNDLRAVIPNRAQGYSRTPQGLQNGEYTSPTQPFAAGALVSSVNDLAKWDAALYTEKVLKRDALQQMWTPTKLTDGKMETYGFGWQIDTVANHKRIAHGGGIPGFTSYILRFPDDRLSIIVLTNQEAASPEKIAMKVAGVYLPAVTPEKKKPIADTEPELTKRLRTIVVGLAKKEANQQDFADEMWKFLYPDRLKDSPLSSLGSLGAFELLMHEAEQGAKRRQYRAVFARASLLVSVALDKEGKITGIGFRPE